MRLFLLLLTAALGLGVACDGAGDASGDDETDQDKEDKAPRSDPRTLVEVKGVVVGGVGDHLVTSGTVEAEAQADLVPELGGTVVALHVEEGDRVRMGQKLATLSNPNLEANQVRAQAEMARARKDHAEVDRLFSQGVISQRELDESTYRLTSARTALDEARLMYERTRITSPIAGTVSVRDVRLGEVAGGGRAFQVVDLSRLRVVVKVPEKDLNRIAVGMTATLTGAYDEDKWVPAEVVRIAPTVDPMSGTVRVTVELDPDQDLLRPGQFVSVRIEVGRHDDVLVIPRRALSWQDGEPIAFRVGIEEPPPPEPDPDDEPEDEEDEEADKEEPLPGPYRIAREVDLVLGFQDNAVVEVMEGLTLGDEVVTNGAASLRDGARVRFDSDPTLNDANDGDAPEEAAADPEAEAKAEAG
jgi:membrane fusion protein, multidrug efflux system